MRFATMFKRPFRCFRASVWRWTISWAIRGSTRAIQDDVQLLSYRHDEDFIEKTRAALTFIKANDWLNYQRVTSFLRMITDLGFGGGYYDPRYHAYHVNQFQIKEEVVESYAANIIHEAVHGRLERCRVPYRDNEARHENLCKKIQARFLDRIGKKKLADIVRATDEWWSPEVRIHHRAMFIENMQRQCELEGKLLDRCLARFYGMMAREVRTKGKKNELKPVWKYQKNGLNVLEFDCDEDGKIDQVEYYEDDLIQVVELYSQQVTRMEQRHIYRDGQLSRVEKLRQDGTTEYIGYIRYSKQGTRKEIYWTMPDGHLTTVQLYIGKELVGKSLIDNKGVVIEAHGQIQHHVGERIVWSPGIQNPGGVPNSLA